MLRFLLIILGFFLILSCSDNGVDMPDDPMEEDPMEEEEEMEALGDTIRFASYNVSMFGSSEGLIAEQMNNANQFARFKRLGAVIQSVSPDVLVLMEFDYDETGEALRKFNDNLLSVSHNGDPAIDYPYSYQFVSNTGVIADRDIDGDGQVSLPNDAYGFGNFPGQYAFGILSKYELDESNIRSFRQFLWKDMPDAALPVNPDGSSYYSEEALEVFRLSSKNHVDIPIIFPNGKKIHAILAHPTPPVFDGAEDRNGRRNHDEIRLIADYLSNETYLIDDNGIAGGLADTSDFIVFGDLNADPLDGDSYNNAINLLLNHERINMQVSNGQLIPSSNGGAEHNQRSGDSGDPAFDTSFFGLRIDYALPSKNLDAVSSGVYWPSSSEANYDIVKDELASDHLLVWLDLAL